MNINLEGYDSQKVHQASITILMNLLDIILDIDTLRITIIILFQNNKTEHDKLLGLSKNLFYDDNGGIKTIPQRQYLKK